MSSRRAGRHDRQGDTHIDGSLGVQIVKSGSHGTQHNYWRVVLNVAVNPIVVASAVIAFVALGVAILYLKPWVATPDVRLAAYSVAAPATIDGDAFEEGVTVDGPYRADHGQREVPVTPIDITLKNNGAAPAVVVEAVVTVVFAGYLADCSQTGGPLQVAANYHIGLPTEPPARPFAIHREMRFEVKPHTSERFTLTIGPEVQRVESPDAWIYVADISLNLDYRSEPLSVGRAGWIAQSGDGYDNLEAGLGGYEPWPCLEENAAVIAEFDGIAAQRSNEATTLIKRYSHLTAPDGSIYRPTCADTPYDPAADISGLCVIYTKDTLLASVSLHSPDLAEGQQLLLQLSDGDGTVLQVAFCELDPHAIPAQEVALLPPNIAGSTIAPCSDYRPDLGRVTLYAYPEHALEDDELLIHAQMLPGDNQRTDASPAVDIGPTAALVTRSG